MESLGEVEVALKEKKRPRWAKAILASIEAKVLVLEIETAEE